MMLRPSLKAGQVSTSCRVISCRLGPHLIDPTIKSVRRCEVSPGTHLCQEFGQVRPPAAAAGVEISLLLHARNQRQSFCYGP